MLFDLLNDTSKYQLDNLEDFDKFIFYHYTIFDDNKIEELIHLRSLIDLINDKNSQLGKFLIENDVTVDISNLTVKLRNEPPILLKSGADPVCINNLYQRLTNDYTISGFLIDDFWDYSSISEYPEIIHTLNDVINKSFITDIDLCEKWKSRNFSTYQIKCIAPVVSSNRLQLKKKNIIKAINNFTSLNKDYSDFLVTDIDPKNIEILDIKKIST